MRLFSEVETQSQLHNPGCSGAIDNTEGAWTRNVGCTSNPRESEVGMVKGVECVHAKLKLDLFRNWEVLA
jgi:hypothetical protein